MAKITKIVSHDVRFPTTLDSTGSDAINFGDYSGAFAYIYTDDSNLTGYGMTFTNGFGNDIVCLCIDKLAQLCIGKDLDVIFKNFGKFWKMLVSDPALRWIGPEKGVIHLATAAIINGLWDLWGKIEKKPVWKLISEMDPETLVNCIDFTHIDDALTPEEALAILKEGSVGKEERIQDALSNNAVPVYTTTAGWLGYDDEKMKKLMHEYLGKGYKIFKFKVGKDLADDKRRLKIARDILGDDAVLMIDANQVWNVKEAIEWVNELAEFKPWFIEEPTSPDDVVGHSTIRKALKPIGIKVATGEMAQNRVIWKQLFQLEAIDYAQVDACRMGGLNEVLAVLLMAKKFGVQVIPHSGGVGLPEFTQHISTIDYVSIGGKKSLLEYVDHLHEHFVYPSLVDGKGYVISPSDYGYSVELKESSLNEYEYPNGTWWKSDEAIPVINRLHGDLSAYL